MKSLFTGLYFLGFVTLKASAQAAGYAQCGGNPWTGPTTCVAGFTCVFSSQWYSQCVPSTGSTTSAPTTTPTTTKSSTTTSATTTALPPSSTGFVKTSGTKFTLNGAPFPVLGGNAYYVATDGLSRADIDIVFKDAVTAGGNVVRTWGFTDVTSATGNYLQSWNGSVATINTGATGLGHFDTVVASAKANGIRLIVPLTNNWGDYGGMDVYVKQITGTTTHSLFYTDARVIAAYKNYIKVFVSRYVNEPTIMAWELGNEPRCNLCATSIITTWATNISAYIKSLDANHLVALGDEGFYNQSSGTYPYTGGEGIDFDANLKISTLDFGTVHAYPDPWGQTQTPTTPATWGVQWIKDHATSMTAAKKPVILEEFGVVDAYNQTTTYTQWYATIESSGLTGDLIWQLGSTTLSYGSNWDDGYTIYPNDPVYALEKTHNAKMKTRG